METLELIQRAREECNVVFYVLEKEVSDRIHQIPIKNTFEDAPIAHEKLMTLGELANILKVKHKVTRQQIVNLLIKKGYMEHYALNGKTISIITSFGASSPYFLGTKYDMNETQRKNYVVILTPIAIEEISEIVSTDIDYQKMYTKKK